MKDLQTALLLVPRMSWLRWFKKIPSALRRKKMSKRIQFHKITPHSPVVPVEDALYILLFLAYSLTEISVP